MHTLPDSKSKCWNPKATSCIIPSPPPLRFPLALVLRTTTLVILLSSHPQPVSPEWEGPTTPAWTQATVKTYVKSLWGYILGGWGGGPNQL